MIARRVKTPPHERAVLCRRRGAPGGRPPIGGRVHSGGGWRTVPGRRRSAGGGRCESRAAAPSGHAAPAAVRIAALPQPRAGDGQAVALRRIDQLLAIGALLVALSEAATEDEQRPGRLQGAFALTQLPLRVKQIELSLSALRALGGSPPPTVAALVADPGLFGEQGSALIMAALDELDGAIRAESLAPA